LPRKLTEPWIDRLNEHLAYPFPLEKVIKNIVTNISKTIIVGISITPIVIVNIILGGTCTHEEVDAYKALFQEFCDIFSISCVEMLNMDPHIVEHCINVCLMHHTFSKNNNLSTLKGPHHQNKD
jgi:hypothetical protein